MTEYEPIDRVQASENTPQNQDSYIREPEKTGIDRKEVSETLEDVEIHSFEFTTIDVHSQSIEFTHKELGLSFFCTPLGHIAGDSEKGKIGFQLDGGLKTSFKALQGKVAERKEFDPEEGLTYREYLQIVRDFIEENLVRSRWESVDSEDAVWGYDNNFTEDSNYFGLRIREREDGSYVLSGEDGVSGSQLETGDKTKLVSKAILYMQENPLGLGHISYQKVIEESNDYSFTGVEPVEKDSDETRIVAVEDMVGVDAEDDEKAKEQAREQLKENIDDLRLKVLETA